MSNIQVPPEVLHYALAKFYPIENEKFRVKLEFDITQIDCLKPFVVLDYIPENYIKESIAEGYCLTSGIEELRLDSRLQIISRVVSDCIGWENILKEMFGINFRRVDLGEIITSRSIKDIYIILLTVDQTLMEKDYLKKSVEMFKRIECSILDQMRIILEKSSVCIEDKTAKSFVDFEIATIAQKTKDRETYTDHPYTCIVREARRRLSTKISSLHKRMS